MRVKNRPLTKKEGKVEGLRLACRYSLNCENARPFRKKIRDFLIGKQEPMETEEIKVILSKLDSYKYYLAISKMNRIINPLDRIVVSHYWKGTPRLSGNLWHNYTTLIPILNMPAGLIKTEIVDECLVHPAKIKEKDGNILTVRYPRISKTRNGLELPKKRFYEKEVLDFTGEDVKKGDYVTIHFSTAVEKINADEFKNLLKTTYLSLKVFNKKHSRGAKYHHAFLNVPNK